jgi:hypothetical protein
MSSEIIVIWIGSIVISCLATAALVIFWRRPKVQVTEVKEVIRYPSELITLERDFVLDYHKMMRCPPSLLYHQTVMDLLHEMIEHIPKNNLIEIIKWPDYLMPTGDERYTIKLRIMPPKK